MQEFSGAYGADLCASNGLGQLSSSFDEALPASLLRIPVSDEGHSNNINRVRGE